MAISADYSQDYSEAVSNRDKVGPLPNKKASPESLRQLGNTPSMAQLDPSPEHKPNMLSRNNKNNILLQSRGGSEYTDENVSYELNHQVASSGAFAAAKRRGADIEGSVENYGSDFFLDEDNISVKK